MWCQHAEGKGSGEGALSLVCVGIPGYAVRIFFESLQMYILVFLASFAKILG